MLEAIHFEQRQDLPCTYLASSGARKSCYHWYCYAVQEPNFHVLYLELMEQMNKPMMDKHLASTTFKYIKILLRSDRIKTQVSCTIMVYASTFVLYPLVEFTSTNMCTLALQTVLCGLPMVICSFATSNANFAFKPALPLLTWAMMLSVASADW